MSSQSSGVEKGGGGGSSSSGEIIHNESTTTIQHQPIDLAAHRIPAVVQLRTLTGKVATGNITATPTGTPSSIISVNNRSGPNLTILPARGVGQPIGSSSSNTGGSSNIGTVSASSTTSATGQIPTYQIARGTIVGNVRSSNLTTGHQGSITVTPISTSNFSNIRLTGPVNNGAWIQSSGNTPGSFATITVSGRTVRPDGKMIHIPQSGHVAQLQMVDNKGSILKPQLTATPLMRAGTANTGTPLALAPFTIRATNLPIIQRPINTSSNTANQVQKVITSPAHGPPIQLLSTQKLPHAIQTITPIPRITCLTLSTHGNVAPNNTAPVVSSKQGTTSLIMTPSVSTGSSLPITKVYPVCRDGIETLFATSQQQQQQQQAVSSSISSTTIPISTGSSTIGGGPISHQQTTLNLNPISFTAVTGGQTQLPNVVIAASSTSNLTNTTHLINSSGNNSGIGGQTTTSGNNNNNTPLTHGHGHHLVQVHGPITVNSVINQSSNNTSNSGPTISISTPGTMTQSYYHVDSKNLHHPHHQQQQQLLHGRPITIEKRSNNTIGESLLSSNKNLLPGSTVILTTTSAPLQAMSSSSSNTPGHILHTVQNPNNNNTSIVIPTTTPNLSNNPNHITISHSTGNSAFSNTISNLSTLQTHSILTPVTTTTTSSIGSISSSINLTQQQQQQLSGIPAHVISSQNFGGTITSNNSNILHNSSHVIPNLNTNTTTSSSSSVIVTSSSSNTIITGNTFQSSSSSNSDIRSGGSSSTNNNNLSSSLVTPNTVVNNNNNNTSITTNTNSNNIAVTSSSNSMSTGTTTTTTTMQTSAPAQSPSSQNQTKSTLSPRPSILRKRDAAADHHNLSLPLRAQRNLALNFAIGSSSGHNTASSASSLVNSTTTSTSTTTASSSSNIMTSTTVNINNNNNNNNSNNINTQNNNNSGNVATTMNSLNTNSIRDSGNIHITSINNNNNSINFINSISNNSNVPTVSLVTSNQQQQSLNPCKDSSSSSSMAQISSSSSITQQQQQQTLVPGSSSSILKKEFLPPNEESSWQSCSSNSSGSTTISTTSETAEIQMQQSQHTMLSANGNHHHHHHHHGLLPTVTVTGLNELSSGGGGGSLSYGSLISGGPISQNGIIRSANNSLRPKSLNKNNPKDSGERTKGRQDKDDGVSPRKKPRKQQLPTSDLFDSASPEISFYQGKRFKKSELIDPKMFEDFHERLNEESTAANEEPQISYYIKKPQMSLLQSNKFSSKPPHNHFQRYCDVKSKDERRPTVNDLLNQKNVIQKANGWKLQHLNNQVEEVIALEGDVVDRFSDLLSKLEIKIGSSCTDRDLNRIMELLKGNIQRGKVIRDQMLESKSQVLKILEHKPRILDVINKYNSKRPIKKREKF